MTALVEKVYEVADRNGAILKGYIKLSDNTNCLIFAHSCDSTLFYKKFFKVSREILLVNKVVKKNLKEIKQLVKASGYKKVWSRGVFSFYGDLRPLSVEADFGHWANSGIIENETYGTDFLLSAIFFRGR